MIANRDFVGMSLLVGSIVFMGAVTGVANHQPHVPTGETQSFRYSYAGSFYMLNLAFCLDEVSGVLSVYLFIIRHKETVKRRHARLNAYKTSKSDRMHNYFRRQSRLLSTSSAYGEGERRSSRNSADTSHRASNCTRVERDTSHMTMLTAVTLTDSHNNIQAVCKARSPSNHHTARDAGATTLIEDHSRCNGRAKKTSSGSFTAILPPMEFQTECTNLSTQREDNCNMTNNSKFKTTSV